MYCQFTEFFDWLLDFYGFMYYEISGFVHIAGLCHPDEGGN